MKLVNQTPLPAALSFTEIDGVPVRLGMLTAKATFRIDGTMPELETQSPHPLHSAVVAHEYGGLPPDLVPRRTDTLEVFVLASAHAPRGRAVEAMTAAWQIGNERRETWVYGDRYWEGSGARAIPSKPIPFTRMPLTWDRAFGGTVDLYVDPKNAMPAGDAWNPLGKGFDPYPYVTAYAQQLGAAPGFPLVAPQYRRALPNLENPSDPVREWGSAPKPWCFATSVDRVTEHLRPRIERQLAAQMTAGGGEPIDAEPSPEELEAFLAPENAVYWDEIFFRSHPDARVSQPEAGAIVRLEGLHPERTVWTFPLPSLRVMTDFVIEGKRGQRELVPQSIVILPDEAQLTVTYRLAFNGVSLPGDERSMRLRLEPGWYTQNRAERD